MNLGVTVALTLIAAAYLASSIKVIPEYQRGVIFRLGRVEPQPRGPGLVMILVPIDRMVRVSLAEQKIEVPAQDVVTRDELTRRVAAEVMFRVFDPIRALTELADYQDSILKLASVALLTACRQVDADEIGAKTATIGAAAQKAMDDLTGRWGVKILEVNVTEA